ncbi:MAG: hypothetical protein BWK80_53380 [Desulfobacteraceae bacterium IS3]|nr:MAG: hypothetical protein BWK80_53380 [Desulfobacteraceae bacterium IS3]
MFKVIQGIYQKGKICISQFIDVKDETQILIVFSDSSEKSSRRVEVCVEIPLISSAGPDTLKLDSIDVTVSTKEKYNKELSAQYNDGEEHGRSAFFSSDPVDIGYTDESLLDSIIGGLGK